MRIKFAKSDPLLISTFFALLNAPIPYTIEDLGDVVIFDLKDDAEPGRYYQFGRSTVAVHKATLGILKSLQKGQL